MNLFYIVIVNLWFSVLDQKDMRDFIKNEISFTGYKIQTPLKSACWSAKEEVGSSSSII